MKRCSSDLVSTSLYFDKKDSINTILPRDMIQVILSYLDLRDRHSTVLVSKKWKEVTIDLQKEQIFQKIKAYAIFLCKNLENYEEKEILLQFLNGYSFRLNTLPEIASSAKSVKYELLDGLDQLSLEDLQKLKELKDPPPLPSNFKDFFELTELFIKLNDPDDNHAETILSLLQHRYLNKVVNYIENSDPDLRGYAMFPLIYELCPRNDFKSAIELANLITNDMLRGMILEHICKDLSAKKHFGMAVQVFNEMPNNYYKKTSGAYLIYSLKEAGELELKALVKQTLGGLKDKPPVIVNFR